MENTKEIVETVDNAVEETVERPYTLRRLKDCDLFPILDILGKVLPDDLATVLMQVVSKEKSLKEVGVVVVIRLVKAIFSNMGKVKDELYNLLSDVSGITVDELEEMPFGTSPMMVWDIINNEKNASFFKVLSKLS